MLGLLPFQGVVYLLNQYHRALPWAKSKLCPFRAQADKTIHRTHVELAKKVQREVQINLPRKVGIIAKNHFTDNFRKGSFVNSSLEPWQITKRQQSGRGVEGKYTPLTSRRDHLMRSITSHPRPEEVTIINDVEYANIHNEGGVVNPKVTDKMRKFAWYKVYSLAGIRKGSKKKVWICTVGWE